VRTREYTVKIPGLLPVTGAMFYELSSDGRNFMQVCGGHRERRRVAVSAKDGYAPST
jgi:hypothetical protein